MDSSDRSARDVVTGAIRMHLFATAGWGQTHCRCQRDTTSADFGMDYPEHIDHVAAVVLDALEASGFTVARLRKGYDPARDCLVIEVDRPLAGGDA